MQTYSHKNTPKQKSPNYFYFILVSLSRVKLNLIMLTTISSKNPFKMWLLVTCFLKIAFLYTWRTWGCGSSVLHITRSIHPRNRHLASRFPSINLAVSQKTHCHTTYYVLYENVITVAVELHRNVMFGHFHRFLNVFSLSVFSFKSSGSTVCQLASETQQFTILEPSDTTELSTQSTSQWMNEHNNSHETLRGDKWLQPGGI